MNHPTVSTLDMLRKGNARFVAGESAWRFSEEHRASMLKEQKPLAAIVGCSDSRVPVEIIFDADPGDLFVVRTAGHVLAAASLASLRFAVEKLGVSTIIVLGHENCGAVNAALSGVSPEWFSPILQHINVDVKDPVQAAINHVLNTVTELEVFFSSLSLSCKPPSITGAFFSLRSGKVEFLRHPLDSSPEKK